MFRMRSSRIFKNIFSILGREMKLVSLLVLVLLSIQSSYGQQVSGVVQHDNNAIEYCNVMVKNVEDSAFVSGTVTDQLGTFVIDKIGVGNYFLEVSCIGYEKQRIPFTVISNQNIHLRVELLRNETFLDEVTVTASHKIWKRTNNSLAMKVEGTPLADMISAIDVLAYMPGVMADNSGIKLIGKDNLLILIDNRVVSSFSEVENLSVNSIKTVALEKNTGVRYNSKYKSVLRITTKERSGNSVEISQRTKVGRKISNTENANFYLASNKITLNGGVITNFRNDLNYYTVETQNVENNVHYISRQSIQNKRKGFDASLGLKYEFSNNHYLQLYDDFYYTGNKPINKSTTEYIEPGLHEQIFTEIAPNYNEKNNRLNLFYNLPILKDSHLELNLDYIYQSSDDNQAIKNSNKQKTNEFCITYKGRYNVYLAQLNYVGTFWRSFDGNLGLDYMNLTNNTFSYNNAEMANAINNEGEHKEQQIAYYINLKKQLNKFGLQAGIRYETVRLKYKDTKEYAGQTKRINSLFPFMSLEVNLSSKWNLSLTYDRKMNLPSYQQLNPIITYYDKYSYRIGNPNLEPVYFNNFSLSALYDNILNLYAEYSFIRNQIQEVPMTDAANRQVIKVIPVNIAKNHQISIGANLTKRFGKHQIGFHSALLAQKNQLDNLQVEKHRFFTSVYVSVNYNYRLRDNINYYVRMNYTGKTEDTVFKQYPAFSTSTGITFSFFDKRMQLNIACNDLFRTENSDWEVKYLNINNLQRNNADSRYFSIYLKYNVNKTSRKNKVKSLDNILNRL